MNSLQQTLVLAQDGADAAVAGLGVFFILYFALIIVVIAGLWMTFSKAGKPGWGSIIPIYNVILLMEIAGRPVWWFLLLFIPVVGLVVAIIAYLDVARKFGKGAGFGIGLVLLPFIFFPILGFGSAQYNAAA